MTAWIEDEQPDGRDRTSTASANGSPNAALTYVRSIVDTVREPLVVLDHRLRVQSANRAFYRTFRAAPQGTEGRLLYDLGNGQWNIPRLRTLLEEILPRDTTFDDFDVEHDFPDIGRKRMLLNARKLRLEGAELILLAIEDVTERQREEAERREIDSRFTSLVKNIKDHSIFTLDLEGRVTSWNVAAENILGYTETEALGRHFSFIFTSEDREQGLPEGELRIAREQGRAEDERWHLRKHGKRFWAQGIVSPLHDADGQLTGFSKILRDMTARKEAEKALQEANRRKDVFLAALAHELRNPLMPLRASLDLLQTQRGDSTTCEEPLRIMDRQLNHLARLVDDLLDISRISRGKIQIYKEQLDLAQIIEAALDISAEGLSQGNRQLSVHLPDEPMTVTGDRVRLVQIVANLLNNAAKFTEDGGNITLRVTTNGDRGEVQVQDDGLGIPSAKLSEIFEPFAQGAPERGSGLGIGLALVQSLTRLHGGTVAVASEGPGRGATFTVSLPLGTSAPSQPSTSAADATQPSPQCRILVVDDDADIREALRLLLTKLKTEVRVAQDGPTALQICDEWRPTHVLMDLGMPGMDGYEAARRLCANRRDRGLRLIALTGWGQDEDRERARRAGFDQLLIKPVSVAKLKTLLST